MASYRCMKNLDGWQKETPDNISAWLWQNDGAEAVVVDDSTRTYYCGRPVMMETYREAWAKEHKPNDNRKAAMFLDLDCLLFKEEQMSEQGTYQAPQIDMIPVESSNIEAVGHDGSETLRIRFKGSATRPATDYDYVGIIEDDFIGLVNSESVGRAYQALTKGKGITGIKLNPQMGEGNLT